MHPCRPGSAVAGLLACLLMACPEGRAQVAQPSDYLGRMDTDGDGRVSPDEYLAWMGYAFAQMDRNGDGVLSADELPGGKGPAIPLAQHRERIAERFRKQDANGDGFLDARELSAPPRR